MSTQQEKTPKSLSAAVRNPRGEISLQWDAVTNATNYIVQIRELPLRKNTRWNYYDIVYEPFCILSGLKPDKNYEFRIAAVSETGQKNWSEIISKKIINRK